jgi:hypothetical protein
MIIEVLFAGVRTLSEVPVHLSDGGAIAFSGNSPDEAWHSDDRYPFP